MVPNVFVGHPVFPCKVPVDSEDAVALHSQGLTVGEAVPIICKYAQPGSELFITDEHGVPRKLEESLWDRQEGNTLYYRMENLDMKTARHAHESLRKEYRKDRESQSPIIGVGYTARADPLNTSANYVLLTITLDKTVYTEAVVGEPLETPPEGFPSFFRNPDRTYCIPILYRVSTKIYAA